MIYIEIDPYKNMAVNLILNLKCDQPSTFETTCHVMKTMFISHVI